MTVVRAYVICFERMVVENNKSAGLDGIKNEMLKNGIQCLLPCMMKLFNLILSKKTTQNSGKLAI